MLSNDKNKTNGNPESDENFSVSGFAEFLRSHSGGNGKNVNLLSDDEQVIEPFDEDAPPVVKEQEKPAESAPVEEPAELPKTEEALTEKVAQDDGDLSGDEFIDKLFNETQNDIFADFGSLQEEISKMIPGTQPASSSAEIPAEAVTHEAPIKASSFSDAVHEAMIAEGFETSDDRFNLSADEDIFESSFESPEEQATAEPAKVTKTKDTGKKKKKSFLSGLFPGRNDSTMEIFRKMVLLVSIGTMIVCIGIIGNTYLLQPFLAEKNANSLLGLRNDGTGTIDELQEKYTDVVFPENIRLNLAEYYAINPSFYGFLSVDGTDIKMPTAKGKNNRYYLEYDFNRKYTKYGCPFVNYKNSAASEGLDMNTTIFGHNMEYDDLVFGQLENFRTIDGFKKSPIISLETLYEEYKFKIYAVFVASANYDSEGYFFNYMFTQLSSEAVMAEYINQIDQRKIYSTGVDIHPSDKLITLSTCCYDFDGARLVVVGRLVRDGESDEVDTSKATANTNPRYPAEWYRTKGKSNPFASASKWIPH